MIVEQKKGLFTFYCDVLEQLSNQIYNKQQQEQHRNMVFRGNKQAIGPGVVKIPNVDCLINIKMITNPIYLSLVLLHLGHRKVFLTIPPPQFLSGFYPTSAQKNKHFFLYQRTNINKHILNAQMVCQHEVDECLCVCI